MSPESQNMGTSGPQNSTCECVHQRNFEDTHTFKCNPCAILWGEFVLPDYLRQMVALVVFPLDSCAAHHLLHTAYSTFVHSDVTLGLHPALYCHVVMYVKTKI